MQRLSIVESKLPEPGAWLVDQQAFYHKILRLYEIYKTASTIEEFSPKTMAECCVELLNISSDFSNAQTPLFLNKKSLSNVARTALSLEALAFKAFHVMLLPIMPNLAVELGIFLNVEDCSDPNDVCFFDKGHIIKNFDLNKINEVDIDAIKKSLPYL